NVEVDDVVLGIALLEHESVGGLSVLPDAGNVGPARAPEVDHHAHGGRLRHARRGCKPNRVRYGSIAGTPWTADRAATHPQAPHPLRNSCASSLNSSLRGEFLRQISAISRVLWRALSGRATTLVSCRMPASMAISGSIVMP